MAEGGSGIMDRILAPFRGTPKSAEIPAAPATPTTPPQSSEELRQMIEGKDGKPAPRDYGGAGVAQNDRRVILGEERATSPGAATLEETKKRLEAEAAAGISPAQVESPTTQPAYLGPSEDDRPLEAKSEQATAEAPAETPSNVVRFPETAAKPTETPKPLENTA